MEKFFSDRVILFLIVVVAFSLFGFMLYGNYQICKLYYLDVNPVACMASSKLVVPAKSGK